jgi:hypothetical protein
MVASRVAKSKPPIIAAIVDRFATKREVPPLAPGDYIRISSLSSMCAREEILRSLHGVTRYDNVEPDLNLIFAHGSGLHYTLQNNILPVLDMLYGRWTCLSCGQHYGGSALSLEKDVSLESLVVLRPDKCACGGLEFLYRELHYSSAQYRLTGHPDGFIRIPQYDGLGVLEAKSISTKGAWEVRSCPRMDHVVQAQMYLWVTGLNWAQILYWDKGTNGTAGLVEHHIERDDETIEQVLSLIRSIWEGIASKALPDRICMASACPRAVKCSVTSKCFAGSL